MITNLAGLHSPHWAIKAPISSQINCVYTRNYLQVIFNFITLIVAVGIDSNRALVVWKYAGRLPCIICFCEAFWGFSCAWLCPCSAAGASWLCPWSVSWAWRWLILFCNGFSGSSWKPVTRKCHGHLTILHFLSAKRLKTELINLHPSIPCSFWISKDQFLYISYNCFVA